MTITLAGEETSEKPTYQRKLLNRTVPAPQTNGAGTTPIPPLSGLQNTAFHPQKNAFRSVPYTDKQSGGGKPTVAVQGRDQRGGVAGKREVEVRGGGLLLKKAQEQAPGAGKGGGAAGVKEHCFNVTASSSAEQYLRGGRGP